MVTPKPRTDKTPNSEPGQIGGIENPHHGRPQFSDAADYVAHVSEAVMSGRRPWAPQTVAELKAVATIHPDIVRQECWWPSAEVCRSLGIDYRMMEADPYGERFRLRMLATMQNDPGFRNAVASLIKGGRQ